MNSLGFTITEIPIGDIVFPDGEMRSQVSFEGLDELSRSIRHLGLMNPISVRPKGNKYELIAGFRRTKACEMCGMVAVPARVFESTDDIADLQKAHENIFREEVSPLDEGGYFRLMLQKHNWKVEELALQVHKSPSYVARRISLGDCPDDIKEALKDAKINLSIAEELTRIRDAGARARLLYLVIQNGASVDVVRSWRVQYEVDAGLRANAATVAGGGPPGTPGVDPARPFLAGQDPGPQFSLTEQVQQWRVCHACLNKVDADKAKLLVLCPECAAIIEAKLPGGADTLKEKAGG